MTRPMTWFLIPAALACALNAVAAEKQKGFKFEAAVKLTQGKKSAETKTELILAEGGRAWVPLGEMKLGTLVLGRPTKEGFTSLEMEFLVVNTQTTPHQTVAIPPAALGFE